MPAPLNNPKSVAWSHSDRKADFYEFPTDGVAMHEALSWLLMHYEDVKLWMGLESEDGAELYLTCSPSQCEEIVNRLQVHEEHLPLFEMSISKDKSA
ncbi:MAG: hypothetical protein AAGH40_11745 [Verrucomicrobiota bacterium]